MRSAGCVINDFADRHFDAHVERTRNRPLASGKISTRAALIFFFILCFSAFLLVLFLNCFTILLAFIGAALAVFYPFMKRFTHLPQLGLGAAFAWGGAYGFCCANEFDSSKCMVSIFTAALWPVIYDTMYAMVDRADDLKIGIKSTAILFGRYDVIVIAWLQIIFLMSLVCIGLSFHLNLFYFVSVLFAAVLCCYQLRLIKNRDGQKCFSAFLNNQWIGAIIFAGIVVGS